MDKPFKDPSTICIVGGHRFKEIIIMSEQCEKYKVIFHYSRQLAVAIQIKMNNGLTLEVAAIESFKEVSEKFADEEVHVSLTMKGEAVEILEDIWTFGKELSVWYRLFSLEHPTCL